LLRNAAMKATELTIFLEYTRRFDVVMSSFPPEFRVLKSTHAVDQRKDEKDCLVPAIRLINLWSEEYFLAEVKDAIDNEVWEVWKANIATMLRHQVIRQVWDKQKVEYDAKFRLFVDALAASKAGK
jgi:hypothetical protein